MLIYILSDGLGLSLLFQVKAKNHSHSYVGVW